MAKISYTCSSCGETHNKWAGQCDGCGEWNTLTGQAPLSAGPGKTLGRKRGNATSIFGDHSQFRCGYCLCLG